MSRHAGPWTRGAAAVAAVLLIACATLPDGRGGGPASTAPVTPLPATQAQAATIVQGRRGAVSAEIKARDLQRAEVEGLAALFERQLGVLAARGEADVYRGNAARLLVDGPSTYAAMRAAIEQARHRVLLEMYIVEDKGVAAEFAQLLMRKAAAGVRVALLYDGVGSLDSDRAFFDRLRSGGVLVCEFNPIDPTRGGAAWAPWQRNHRKVLVVDGDIAFTGGINLSNVYAAGSSGPIGSGRPARAAADGAAGDTAPGWRDTQIELRGPVVQPMAATFGETWRGQACPGTLPPAPPPRQRHAGTRIVKLTVSDPRQGINRSYADLLAAIGAAQRSVFLTMAYFAPGDAIIDALRAAARRGVDVQLVLPGRSDVKMVMYAAHGHYESLLQAGVKIHEMHHAVMHAKTAVIDGVFSSVGSSNLDSRSIGGNQELDVVVLGEDFGAEMEQLFERDLAASRAVDLQAWQRRGLGARFMEWLARTLEPLL